MSRRALISAALAAILLAVAVGAILVRGADPGVPDFWPRALGYIMEQQRLFHRELSNELTALGRETSLAAAWALIASSFLYGVFHAAGPGHGKVVLTTYLVSHERRIGRAMALSCAAAFCQGVVAIVLVYGLVWGAGFAGRETQGAALWAERASFAMIAALGLYLVARSLRGLFGAQPHAHAGEHRHGDHDHHHDHGACGHVHVVSPEAAQQVHGLRTALAVILSVGLRPCSGAVLVLAVANILHLAWAGVAAVLAMSAGTAITVCGLALAAVYASDRAARLVDMRGRALVWSARAVSLVGGALILAVGIALFIASFGAAHPLGMGTAY